jgi:hypothetical protein
MNLSTILVLNAIVTDGRRSAYACRVLGGPAADGLWDGYLEFRSSDGSVLVTPRETRQPNKEDLAYWASSIGPIYLEGALQRARDAANARTEEEILTPPLSQSR